MATTIQLKNCWQEVAGFPADVVGWTNLVSAWEKSEENGSQGGVIGDNKSQAGKARREKEKNGYYKYFIEK